MFAKKPTLGSLAIVLMALILGSSVSGQSLYHSEVFSQKLTVDSLSLQDKWSTIQSRLGAPCKIVRHEERERDITGEGAFVSWGALTVGLEDDDGEARPISLRGSRLKFGDSEIGEGDSIERLEAFFADLQLRPEKVSNAGYSIDIGGDGQRMLNVTVIVHGNHVDHVFVCWLPIWWERLSLPGAR